ncbi:hypothetical protein F2Q70_00010856 [Brassica cretica]|uniref:Uncharacterized protein n=1 Tax=Brassica cretica TaxID=69181 RepID=A0A8S9JC62_BRACR|nr:hypothetical protein F2Q68_00003949 [Brassica cretica]KAF2612403.1 hypothetical protein F2Q70_00010856 [Brassica cretica]
MFVWLPQVSASASAAAAASMKTVFVRFADADAATYYITTADFIGVSRRTRRSDAASDAASCVNETNKSRRKMLTLPLRRYLRQPNEQPLNIILSSPS